MNQYQPELLSAEQLGRRIRGVLARRWGSASSIRSHAGRTNPQPSAPAVPSTPAVARLWYVADGTKAEVGPVGAQAVAATATATATPTAEPVVRIDPVAPAAEHLDVGVCDASERHAAEALTAAVSAVFGLDPETFPEDTIVMPVVGDRVFYGNGSGYLVGLEGVVVRNDDDPDLPSGLRYVQFDGEEWPNVVVVTALRRL